MKKRNKKVWLLVFLLVLMYLVAFGGFASRSEEAMAGEVPPIKVATVYPLCSEEAAYITGQVISHNGGFTM